MKKQNRTILIASIIGLIVVGIFIYFGFFQQSFLTDTYGYSKDITFLGYNSLIKSSFPILGQTIYGDQSDCTPATFTKSLVLDNNNFNINLVKTGCGSSSTGYVNSDNPNERAYIKISGLNISSANLNRIEMFIEQSNEFRVGGNSGYSGMSEIYLISDNGDEKKIFQSNKATVNTLSSSKYGLLKVFKSGNQFIVDFNGNSNTIDLNGNYNIYILQYTQLGYFAEYSKIGLENDNIKITNFKINQTTEQAGQPETPVTGNVIDQIENSLNPAHKLSSTKFWILGILGLIIVTLGIILLVSYIKRR